MTITVMPMFQKNCYTIIFIANGYQHSGKALNLKYWNENHNK